MGQVQVVGRSRVKKFASVTKSDSTLAPWVRKVGAEHFGLVCVDPHKGSSKWMLANFFGQELIEACEVAHRRDDLRAAAERIRQRMKEAGLKEVLVAVERSGNYQEPVVRAFRGEGFEVRIIHPFTTKQYRVPADPGNKTDETDLKAMALSDHQRLTRQFGAIPLYQYGEKVVSTRERWLESSGAGQNPTNRTVTGFF